MKKKRKKKKRENCSPQFFPTLIARTVSPATKMATCLLPGAIPNCLELSSFKSSFPRRHRQNLLTPTRSSLTDQSQTLSAKIHLLSIISDQDRGLKTQSDPQKLAQIIQAVDAVADVGRDTVTTDSLLSGTWRLLWTTEKEQLYIIKNAPLFGTKAGDVLQVIDVEKKTLNNVITFPPGGVFFVRSTIEIASSQRVNFRYTCIRSYINMFEDILHNIGFLILTILVLYWELVYNENTELVQR